MRKGEEQIELFGWASDTPMGSLTGRQKKRFEQKITRCMNQENRRLTHCAKRSKAARRKKMAGEAMGKLIRTK